MDADQVLAFRLGRSGLAGRLPRAELEHAAGRVARLRGAAEVVLVGA
jgi:hypothetical protein